MEIAAVWASERRELARLMDEFVVRLEVEQAAGVASPTWRNYSCG